MKWYRIASSLLLIVLTVNFLLMFTIALPTGLVLVRPNTMGEMIPEYFMLWGILALSIYSAYREYTEA